LLALLGARPKVHISRIKVENKIHVLPYPMFYSRPKVFETTSIMQKYQQLNNGLQKTTEIKTFNWGYYTGLD
jgi:hypothetical protein